MLYGHYYNIAQRALKYINSVFSPSFFSSLTLENLTVINGNQVFVDDHGRYNNEELLSDISCLNRIFQTKIRDSEFNNLYLYSLLLLKDYIENDLGNSEIWNNIYSNIRTLYRMLGVIVIDERINPNFYLGEDNKLVDIKTVSEMEYIDQLYALIEKCRQRKVSITSYGNFHPDSNGRNLIITINSDLCVNELFQNEKLELVDELLFIRYLFQAFHFQYLISRHDAGPNRDAGYWIRKTKNHMRASTVKESLAEWFQYRWCKESSRTNKDYESLLVSIRKRWEHVIFPAYPYTGAKWMLLYGKGILECWDLLQLSKKNWSKSYALLNDLFIKGINYL